MRAVPVFIPGINSAGCGIKQPNTMQFQAEKQAAAAQSGWQTLLSHWPEFSSEAVALALFMFSACTFAVLFQHPGSPLEQLLNDLPGLRRAVTGAAMGLTAVLLIRSPLGKRSGAHMNPSITLTYLVLGKVGRWDALFYILAQFAGGSLGVAAAAFLIGMPLRHSAVNYAVTQPGPRGPIVAFAAEAAISFLLMSTVLRVSNSRRLSRYTPLFAGTLVALFITFESPLSGMSMNPARTFGSAFNAWEWVWLGIYFTAPVLGMLAAAWLYSLGRRPAYCAKLDHFTHHRCIFNCKFGELDAF